MSAPSGSYDQGNQGRNPQRDRLSKEEGDVLRECNSESFWYRCVPIGLGLMGGSQYLVNAGILKPHPRYGALFKNLGALLVGYIVGKLSYSGHCRQKILDKIPDSRLAQSIRKKGSYDVETEEHSLPSLAIPIDTESRRSNRDDMHNADFDTDKTPYQTPKGLDDNNRPTMDKLGPPQERIDGDNVSQPNLKSYDDLRKQNRVDYDRQMASSNSPMNQRSLPSPPSQVTSGEQGFDQGRQFPRRPKPVSSSAKNKNQYGDDLEDVGT